jgi:hypothetical protein
LPIVFGFGMQSAHFVLIILECSPILCSTWRE